LLPTPCPEVVADMTVERCEPTLRCPLVFSALDTATAKTLEPACAREGALAVTNASSFRMAPRVPLVIPEVNPEHLEMLVRQDFGHGAIAANPNCTTIGLVL